MNLTHLKLHTFLVSLFAVSIFARTLSYADHHEGKQEHEKHEMEADVNADGKVSYDEFKGAREQNMQEHFNRRDTNKDGFIDQAEKDAAKQNWKKHHGKMKDGEKCDRK